MLRFYVIITYPRHIMSFKTIEPPQYETTVETSVDHSLFCECSSGHSLLTADMLVHQPKPFEFSLNVFIEFSEFSDKNICHYSKRARMCHPVSSVTDQDATTVPARHM